MPFRSAVSVAAAGAFALAASACATANTPVPVSGARGDVAELAGVWEGSYESSVVQRSGIIEFRLEAGQDTAFGSVVMKPGPDPSTGERYDPITGPGAQWLDINFVRCEAGVVTGTLGPYVDPHTTRTLHTTFQGFLKGDFIEGTYTTRVQSTGDEVTGHWRVERTSDSGGK